jgi:hypothetical protein
MLRLALKLLLAGAAAWAVCAFVPFGGRTLADRWAEAATPSEFLDRTWADMKGERGDAARTRPPARSQARTAQPPRAGDRAPARPAERYTDSDRRALDRVLSDGLSESR